MRICLGIDPGLARLGYGAVMQSGSGLFPLRYGCIETSSKVSFTDRLLKIYSELQEVMRAVEPDFVAVERLFFGKNVTSAEYVYQARGVVMLLVAQNNLPVTELNPITIKRTICGNTKASKHEVQSAVRDRLLLEDIPRPDDTADALAAAVAGLSL